jgi:membrane fusion protein (multidrug efflux system)
MKREMCITCFLILLSVLNSFILVGCKKEDIPVKQRDPVAVDVLIAEADDVSEEIEVGGIVEADKEVIVSAEISAVIENQFYREGDRVKKNDLLLVFNDETFVLACESRQAELNKARAVFIKIEEETGRRRELFNRGFIASEEIDASESQFKVARADVEIAQTALKLAKRDLRKTKVYSPLNGIITERVKKTGENVRQGDPLFHIAQYKIVRLVVSVSERDVLNIKEGDKVDVSLGPFGDTLFKGNVKRVGLPSQPSEGVFPVEVVVNNPELRVKPGMVATVIFKGSVHRDVIIVPRNIITERLGESVVFVVNNNKSHARKVRVGSFFGFNVSIEEGINPGDKVVVVGYNLLFDNAPVTIRSVIKRE